MTTKKTRREFTAEFKHEAVVLLRDSGRTLTQVAAEPGLEPSVLRVSASGYYTWRAWPESARALANKALAENI